MNFNKIWKFILSFFAFISISHGYRAVVLLHGILSDAASMLPIAEQIILNHPGTKVYTIDENNNWSSLDNMLDQVQTLFNDFDAIFKKHPEGVHVLGYSQGGLLARCFLQYCKNHNVKKFISLSSPQAGQYGDAFLHLVFPALFARTAYELFYSRYGQKISISNYWNDPKQRELYLKYSQLLPYVNNELLSENSTQFRDNLMKLEEMILIGGPDDDVITPWQSAHFGFFDTNYTVVPMKERSIYQQDTIGLKSLDEKGKLRMVTVPGIKHIFWHLNRTLIDDVVVPLLD